jgi:hypothetical protein
MRTAAEPAEVAAGGGAARVGRHLARHLGEVLAGVEPLLRRRRLGRGLDQHVAGADLLGLAVLLLVLGVVVALLCVAGRQRLLELRLVDEQVVGDALLGHAVLLAVLAEEALQVDVRDGGLAGGEGERHVAHLRLLHLLAVTVLDVLVGDHHRALQRGDQPLQHQLVADRLLEAVGGVAETPHGQRVALGADEVALVVAEDRQVDDVAAQLAVGDAEVEVARLGEQDLVGDQPVERLLGQPQLLEQLLVVLLAELLAHLVVEPLFLALVLHASDRLAAHRRRSRRRASRWRSREPRPKSTKTKSTKMPMTTQRIQARYFIESRSTCSMVRVLPYGARALYQPGGAGANRDNLAQTRQVLYSGASGGAAS